MSDGEDGYDEELSRLREQRLQRTQSDGSKRYDEDDSDTESTVRTAKDMTRQKGLDVTAPAHLIAELQSAQDDASGHSSRHQGDATLLGGPADSASRRVIDRQNAYQLRQRERVLSPERQEVYDASASSTGQADQGGSFKDALHRMELDRAARDTNRALVKEMEKDREQQRTLEKRSRWDHEEASSTDDEIFAAKKGRASEWDGEAGVAAPSSQGRTWTDDETPLVTSQWGETPKVAAGTRGSGDVLATPGSRRSRWDATPVGVDVQHMQTPARGATGYLGTPGALFGTATPRQGGTFAMMDQSIGGGLSDADLDALLPSEGFLIVDPPHGYVPLRTPSRKMQATPQIAAGLLDASGASGGVIIGANISADPLLALLKPEDYPYFSKLVAHHGTGTGGDGQGDAGLSTLGLEEAKEVKVMQLLLKIKNGTPLQRRTSLRQLTEQARYFGAKLLFDKVLPLLMSNALEEQERHLLVKVIDRILYQLEDSVRPYVHNILVVIEPLLIDEDYYARQEGRSIIGHLAKAAGLASMLAALRPDLEHADEYVRNTTARALSVVASSLGVASMLPFLKAVCKSRRTWEARHTGAKVIQQIAILLGPAILPHMQALVSCLSPALAQATTSTDLADGKEGTDLKSASDNAQSGATSMPEHPKVRTMAALAIAALAEAGAPYGLDSFSDVLRPLWQGVAQHRGDAGKSLAAYLKAVGAVLALMQNTGEHATLYARELLVVLKRHFSTSDDELRKIVMHVLTIILELENVSPVSPLEGAASTIASSTGVLSAKELETTLLSAFFGDFWTRRSALDRRQSTRLVGLTVSLSRRIGTTGPLTHLIPLMKDASEAFRRMVIEGIRGIILNSGNAAGASGASQGRTVGAPRNLGFSSMTGSHGRSVLVLVLEERLEEQLMDGMLFAFQEQSTVLEASGNVSYYHQLEMESSLVTSFGIVLQSLHLRAKPYLKQVCSTILWRMNHKTARVRQQAAELLARVVSSLSLCQEDALLAQLSRIVYESMGEEFPDVLAALLHAMKELLVVLGPKRIQPSISELLPRLTPILKNRQTAVQEACLHLIGHIATVAASGGGGSNENDPSGGGSAVPAGMAISAREWMRICFELVAMLRAPVKRIRRVAIATFGAIATTIGPQDVLVALLDNLKVQERQLRVCTTLAIAVVADSCAPFTVLPALMNEYRTPELNVQNGVLKSLAYLFHYIGNTIVGTGSITSMASTSLGAGAPQHSASDYIYAVTPLLVDALMDRDLVHRQTACTAVAHLALAVAGGGAEDALLHLLNHVFPNVLDASPHLLKALLHALAALAKALGPAYIYPYLLPGLFHPARKVRSIYWKIYNNLFINHMDALTPLYKDFPMLQSTYRRDHLYLMI